MGMIVVVAMGEQIDERADSSQILRNSLDSRTIHCIICCTTVDSRRFGCLFT